MSFGVPDENHFEGGQNVNEGHAANGDATLAEILRRFRTGSVTAAGAGTEAVVFNEPFADADYTVSFATDTLATTPEYANKTATGFDIVVAAAGDVDYTAIHD
jgi:hypothetical protein